MRAVAAQGRTVDSLRVAVLAAFNLADELSQAQASTPLRATPARPICAYILDEVLEGERKTASGNPSNHLTC